MRLYHSSIPAADAMALVFILLPLTFVLINKVDLFQQGSYAILSDSECRLRCDKTSQLCAYVVDQHTRANTPIESRHCCVCIRDSCMTTPYRTIVRKCESTDRTVLKTT